MGFTDRMKQVVHSEDVQYDNLFNEDADIQWIGVKDIKPDPGQPRKTIDAARLKELQKTIEVTGVLQPILVRENPTQWRLDKSGYIIIAGERRYRAAVAAGLKSVPCIVKDISETDARLLQLVENLQREDLTQAEAADSYITLSQDFQLPAREIARRTGKDVSIISKTINVYSDKGLRAAVEDDNVPLHVAAALLPLDSEDRAVWIKDIKRERKSGTNKTPKEITEAVAVHLGKSKVRLTDVNGPQQWPVGDKPQPTPVPAATGATPAASSHYITTNHTAPNPEYSGPAHDTALLAPSMNIGRARECLELARDAVKSGMELTDDWRQDLALIRLMVSEIEGLSLK